MTRGRKPKPTHLKVLEGNPGRRPLPKNEPMPEPDIPRCPSHIPQPGKTEWRRIVKELAELGLMTQIDRAALAAYCTYYGRWVEAERHMKKEGVRMVYQTNSGVYRPNPYIALANEAMRGMLSVASEFGLTPAARTRIQVEKPKEEEDALTKLLNKRASG